MYDEAVELLRALTGPDGIRASLSTTANYQAVFTRDAVMAGVAGLLAGDEAVAAGLVRTLSRLHELQGAEGQIASNYLVQADGAMRVSFGTLAPRTTGIRSRRSRRRRRARCSTWRRAACWRCRGRRRA
jgi:hypothetical protein